MENLRFDFELATHTLLPDLTAAYKKVVECAGNRYIDCEHTRLALQQVASWMCKGKQGLFLLGGCGTGKTTMLQAVNLLIQHRSLATIYKQRLGIVSARRINELCLSDCSDDRELLSKYKTYKYLGIDDLGTEPTYVKRWGTTISPTLDILYIRYNHRLTTIITSNDSLDLLRIKYGERMYDRFCELYDRAVFNFPSYRQLGIRYSTTNK